MRDSDAFSFSENPQDLIPKVYLSEKTSRFLKSTSTSRWNFALTVQFGYPTMYKTTSETAHSK